MASIPDMKVQIDSDISERALLATVAAAIYNPGTGAASWSHARAAEAVERARQILDAVDADIADRDRIAQALLDNSEEGGS
jgi:hypothetical protein